MSTNRPCPGGMLVQVLELPAQEELLVQLELLVEQQPAAELLPSEARRLF